MLLRSISGLRGIVGAADGLKAEVITRYAAAFARYHDFKGTVAVGYDGRMGGSQFYDIAIQALITSGCDVFALGMVPTPTVMFAVETKPEIVGGIIITASHNPGEWNGMKFIAETGLFLDAEENKTLWDIVDSVSPESVSAEDFGEMIDGRDYMEQHIQAVLGIPFVDREKIAKRNFRIALDCVNASGSRILPRLVHSLGVQNIIELHSDASGIFPHRPEPVPENLTSLKEAILREKADLGIVVDPDADRLVLIMENGEPFIEENTIVLCAEHVLKHSQKGQSVVVNLSTTRAIEDIAERYSATVFRTPVGEINVAKKMQEVNAIVGGEGSGGVILPLVHTGRDSLVGTALALSALAEFGGPISEKRKELPQYEIVKSKIELQSASQVASVLSVLSDRFSGKAISVDREDGIRFDFGNSWLHARASNTEPIIRIIAEAPTKDEAENLIIEARSDAYKYSDKILEFKIENCPPIGDEINRLGYHWCHSPIDPTVDFIPPGVKKPSRLSKGEMKKRCDLLALSMYTSQDESRRFFEKQSFSESIIQSIGEFIAEGTLEPTDGKASDLDPSGHFNFHEFEGVNLIPKFSVVSKI